jgi:hypothetical protein
MVLLTHDAFARGKKPKSSSIPVRLLERGKTGAHVVSSSRDFHREKNQRNFWIRSDKYGQILMHLNAGKAYIVLQSTLCLPVAAPVRF